MISCDYPIKVGSIFKWHETNTYWICFMQDRTELAYFRGECRECNYKINWVDKDRIKRETLLSVIGPSVAQIRTSSSMAAKIAEDFPNANLKILAQDNELNRGYLQRYGKFLIKGVTYIIHEIDNLSMPGVIQLTAVEHYSNLIEENVETNVYNNWNVQPIIEEYPTDYAIEGPQAIKPTFEYEFETMIGNGVWSVLETKAPVKFISSKTEKKIILVWGSMKSGSFTLVYTANGKEYKRHIIVESLM